MTSDGDPERHERDAPGTMPGIPAAGQRSRTGRTRVSPVPRSLWPAALAPTAVAMLASPDPADPRSASRGELELPGHTRYVNALAFSPDGRTLASGGNDHTVRLWDTTHWADGDVIGLGLLPQASWIFAIAFSPDGSLLATAGDGFATIWSSRPPCEVRSEWAGGLIRAVAFSPDGRTLALAGDGGTIHLLDVPSARERLTLRSPHEMVMGLAFSPDGKLLVSADSGRRVVLWDVAGGVERRVLVPRASHPMPSVAFAPDGRSVAVLEAAARAREVLLLDPESGAIRARLIGYPLSDAFAFAPDGRTLAVAGSDRSIRLFDLGTSRQVAALDVGAYSPRSLAFSPDGRWLAYPGDDDAVRVVDLAARRPDQARTPSTTPGAD